MLFSFPNVRYETLLLPIHRVKLCVSAGFRSAKVCFLTNFHFISVLSHLFFLKMDHIFFLCLANYASDKLSSSINVIFSHPPAFGKRLMSHRCFSTSAIPRECAAPGAAAKIRAVG